MSGYVKQMAALLLMLAGVASAMEVSMQVRPDAVRMGESAELLISVQGVDRPGEPQLPQIPGLRFSPPRVEQSFSMTMVNGRMQETRSVTYSYSVIPMQPGEFTIGPFIYQHRGQQVELPAQVLRVVMPDGQGGQVRELSDLIFARMEVSRNRIYVHEPLRLTIAIYSRDVNLGRDVSLFNMPDSGVQMQAFQELRATREVYQNDLYDVRRYQTEIRPLTAGILRFEPGLRVQLLVPRSEQRRRGAFDDPFFGGLFTNMEAHPFDLNPQPVEVVVQGLPDVGRPDSFTGGVGQFNFQARISPDEIRPGDPITVTVTIEGEGNMDTISAPVIPDSDVFRTYPSRIANQELDRSLTRGRKTYEQIIIPRTADVQEVPALALSFFDPRAERFQTLERGPFPLTVLEGDALAARVVRGDAESINGQRARIIGQDILYLKPAPRKWRMAESLEWYRGPLFWGMQVWPPLLVMGVWWRTRRQRALQVDVARARRERAPGSARAGLKVAERAIASADEEAFFNGLWQGLTGYFGNRLNLAPGAVTAPDVKQAMQRAGMEMEPLARIEQLLVVCDQRRYAGASVNVDEMKRLLNEFRALLKVCEKLRPVAPKGCVGVALLAVLLLALPVQAAAPFQAATEAYDREAFSEAISRYEDMVSAGYRSPELFFNLGNAYYRSGDLGRSVLNYHRALWLAPRDSEARHNAEFVMREADAIATSGGFATRQLHRLSLPEWVAVGATWWWLLALLLVLRLRGRDLGSPAIAVVCGLLIVSGLGIWEGWRLKVLPEVVVVQSNQEALFAPLEGSMAHLSLPPGSRVRVVSEMEGWYRVQVDTKSGWIKKSAVDTVPIAGRLLN